MGLLTSGNAHTLEELENEAVAHAFRDIRGVEAIAVLFPYNVMVSSSLLEGSKSL